MELPKAYEPEKTEGKIYQLWEKSGFFNPDKLPGKRKKTYAICIPPPNVTGELHMGHALNAVIQDILIRKKRMEGYKTLWVPGTDHAGIATQNVVEKNLRKEGKTRFDLGKEKFIERVWEWKDKYGNIILDQFKKIGASCDWSRTRFTMDEEYAKAVEEAFSYYYKKGWIYQGRRVVNWCPRCATSLSDLELEYKEEEGHLWYIKYPLAEEKGNILVATTRPETMLGDTAVAVNPGDKRYKSLIGKHVVLPLVNKEIPIIEDRVIDPEFGTGAVKVTPAHDLTDYDIGQRHNLEVVEIIDEKGRITDQAPLPYRGLKVLEAREKVVEDLKENNFLEKIEDYNHQVPKCYRCGTTVELIPSLQWFLKMDKLAKLAISAVESKRVEFHPQRWEKLYFDWLYNIKDWCISRQIWWGHKIPIEGQDDVLDTWFSSALWPFATLGWPDKTNDLKAFYPTQALVTARDIINLWVARMVYSGLEFAGEEPFKDVIITPTVLTKEGRRMSKSLGTGIDPIKLIEKYGADATRFGIAYQLMGGQDLKFTEDNIIMGKKFCNKIWNATRFVLMKIGTDPISADIEKVKLTGADKKILNSLKKTGESVNKDIENYEFGSAAHTLYDFFWHDYCDQYIEEAKNQESEDTKRVLMHVLLNSLKMLHPFIPFVTEEIYQSLPLKKRKEAIIIEDWPA
ncbi:MAG: valine--tRNA ligase [Candidatus Pacebacteria bacterium]|nr:valine--tRNA ligase [Candidatus Paceibacterota bacterium]